MLDVANVVANDYCGKQMNICFLFYMCFFDDDLEDGFDDGVNGTCPDDHVSYASAARQFRMIEKYRGCDIRNTNSVLYGRLIYYDDKAIQMFEYFSMKMDIPRKIFISIDNIPKEFIQYKSYYL